MSAHEKGTLPKAYLRMDPNIDQTHPDPGGMVRIMCAANRQPVRGWFKSRALMEAALGKPLVKAAIGRRDVVEVDGRWAVPGWDEWQEGDWTVGERQRRIRARRNAGNVTLSRSQRDEVTPTPLPRRDEVTPPHLSPSSPPTPPPISPGASGVGQRAPSVNQKPGTVRAPRGGRGPSGDGDAWSGFGPEWQGFRAAWAERGYRLPPTGDGGDADGEHQSQRRLLWTIVDEWPGSVGAWVREAPQGASPRQVIEHVLTRYHAAIAERQALADAEEARWDADKAAERQGAGRVLEDLDFGGEAA